MKVDVICLGELLIDFVSMDRDFSLIDSTAFKKAPGGAPANVAAGVARLGYKAGFIGKVGNDPFGVYLKKVLDEIQVDTSCMVSDTYARTTLAFIAQKSDGKKDLMFFRNPGADMLLAPEEIHEDYIKQARIFHFGSISLGSELSKKATLRAVEYAKKHGLLISYDPNLRLSLWEDAEVAKREINSGFCLADVVKLSDEESEFITGCGTIEESAHYVLDRGPKLVIITLGEKGCYYTDGNVSGYLEGFKVDVVETTGSGDAFVAGVFYCLLKRFDRGESSLKIDEELINGFIFANAAGALAAAKLGAIPSLPDVQEVERLIKGIDVKQG